MLHNDELSDNRAGDSNVDVTVANPDFVLPDNRLVATKIDIDSKAEDDELLVEGELVESIVIIGRHQPDYVSGQVDVQEKMNIDLVTLSVLKVRWNMSVCVSSHNITKGGLPGLTAQSKGWKTILTKKKFGICFLKLQWLYINVKLERLRNGLSKTTNKSTYSDTDQVEINTLIGVSLLTSSFKLNQETMVCFLRMEQADLI